ncbi:MAG TPA: hypothetical protein VEH06_06935 [Candidatus Bathyarchaeia archaeon]|nr:hypothetical protein [Candidatus Bathyarchaeia archaeon]
MEARITGYARATLLTEENISIDALDIVIRNAIQSLTFNYENVGNLIMKKVAKCIRNTEPRDFID